MYIVSHDRSVHLRLLSGPLHVKAGLLLWGIAHEHSVQLHSNVWYDWYQVTVRRVEYKPEYPPDLGVVLIPNRHSRAKTVHKTRLLGV